MSDDTNIEKAIEQVNGVLAGNPRAPHVKAFFHEPTFTATYVVSDDQTKRAAIIDSVWDFDQPSGRTSLEAADEIIDYVREAGLTVDWILETHAHADHLSAAPYLQEKLGGEMAIGRDIVTVQGVFGKVFNEGTEFERDGSQFDRLLEDGDELMIGDIPLIALHVPGHTPADIAYIVGDEDVDEDEFVDMRTQRDATLEMPRLILPAIQVNMRGGHLPPPEDDGTSYLKMPVNKL